MFQDDLPRQRRTDHSSRAVQRPALIEPADCHARRLGALGHVERLCAALTNRTELQRRRKDRAGAGRLPLVSPPLGDAAPLESIPAVASRLRVAAA